MHSQKTLNPLLKRLAGFLSLGMFSAAMAATPPTINNKIGGTVELAVAALPSSSQLALVPGAPYLEYKLATQTPVLAVAHEGPHTYTASGDEGLLIFERTPDESQHLLAQVHGLGKITHVVLSNGAAYLADSAGAMLIFDVSDPQHPQQIFNYPLSRPVDALCVENGRAYLVSGKQLKILDVSHPAATRLLGEFEVSNEVTAIQATGGYAYLAQPKTGLYILDVHDPAQVSEVAHFHGEVSDVAVTQGRAYLANGDTGLTVLDVGEPQTPRWIGSLNHIGSATALSYDEGYLALRNDRSELMFIDVRNPKIPKVVSTCRSGRGAHAVVLVQKQALSGTEGGLETIDFSAPIPNVSNIGANFGGSRRAVIRDNVLFVADWFSGLHLYDISVPGVPRHLSNYHTQGSSKGVLVRGDYAFVADDDHGVQILDISNLNYPRKISEVATPGLAYTMKLVGDYLYLADHRGGFHIISVSDIAHPYIIGSAHTAGKAWAVEVVGNLAYVAADNAGLLVFDISDPQQPRQLAAYDVGGAAEDVVIRNHFAYVTSFDNGLHIFDISTPLQARELSHLATPGNARGIELVDDLAYIADWVSGIQIVNIADPLHPATVGTYDTTGWSWGVRVQGKYAYVLDWWGGITVLDVTHPDMPTLAGAYHARGLTKDVMVRDGYAYVADGSNGLQIFDVNNPLNPIWMAGVDMAGDAQSIGLKNNIAYLATGQGDVATVDIGNPFEPRLLGKFAVEGRIALRPYDPGSRKGVGQYAQSQYVPPNGEEKRSVDHPLGVDLVRAQGKFIYAAERQRGVAIITAATGQQTAWLAAALNDMWPVKNRLVLATQSGVDIVAVNIAGRPRLIKHLSKSADLVRFQNNLLVLYEKNTGISIYDYATFNLLSRFNPNEEISDIKISGKNLYASGALSGLLVLDISNSRHPVLKAAYSATGQVTRMSEYHGAIFMAGKDTLTEVRLLPNVIIKKNKSGQVTAHAPKDMPLGSYDLLALDPATGERGIYHDVVRVVVPKSDKPRFTMQDLEQAMRKRGLNPAGHQ